MEKIWDKISMLENYKVKSDSDRIFLIDFLRKHISSNNNLLKSEIITCISENGIIESDSTKVILNTLTDKSNYIVKLSALDFILLNRDEFNQVELNEIYNVLILARMSRVRIVRNHALLLLIIFNSSNAQIFIDELINSLKLTNDYRSFIRIFNTIVNHDLIRHFNENDMKSIILIAKRKKFGISVAQAIARLEQS